jgi:putative addiction module component (TIGR02574 family)
MTPNVDAILNEALALPPECRACLAEKLLESLEGADRADIEAAWAEEIEERIRAYDEGRLKTIPVEELMQSFASGG